MLTDDEKKFLTWWELNREKEKNIFYQLRSGLPLGLLLGGAILINFATGWYKRANMVAFGQSTPIALIIAIIIIALFCAIFFKRHKWEMNEQRYKILSKRVELENKGTTMQQEGSVDSH
jgi:sterol desaturase/sphingolipid hydroxylase (fatty acid hydroxylase superfamily)